MLRKHNNKDPTKTDGFWNPILLLIYRLGTSSLEDGHPEFLEEPAHEDTACLKRVPDLGQVSECRS